MSSIVTDIEAIQDQFRFCQETLETCRLQLQSSERSREEQRQQIAQLIQENQTLNAVILKHHKRIQTEIELNRELQLNKEERTQLEIEILELKRQCESRKGEIQRETEHAQRQMQTQQQQIDFLQKQYKEAEAAFNTNLSHLQQAYEKQLQEMKIQLEKMEADRHAVEAELAKERQERALASYARSSSGDSTDVLKARLQKMKAELIRVQKERDALKRH